jgi:AT hook motif
MGIVLLANILLSISERTSKPANVNTDGPQHRPTSPKEPAVAKRKRGRPQKTDHSSDAQEAQSRKKRRVDVEGAFDDTGAIRAQLEATARGQEEGHGHDRDESGDIVAISGPSTAKKGRGRPRKNVAQETEDPSETNTEKKGKGKPDKVTDTNDPRPDHGDPEAGKDREQKTEGGVSSQENKGLLKEDPPKRGRGRPRKPIDPNAPPPDPNTPKRGRGRPRKVMDPNAPGPDSDAPKRPRGRPRKVIDPSIEDTAKRGRGRPRKTAQPEVAPQE